MNKKQAALDKFSKHFNCAQSTFAAFAGDVGIDVETSLKVAACFGGGMRCGEVCGAVTGALMVKASGIEPASVFTGKFSPVLRKISCKYVRY